MKHKSPPIVGLAAIAVCVAMMFAPTANAAMNGIDVASINITTPGEYDVTAGFRAGTTSPPTGFSCKLVTDNGSLTLGPVSNRGSVWIGDTNTYSVQPHDLLTVTTTPCKVTLQAWSGKTATITGASIIARRVK